MDDHVTKITTVQTYCKIHHSKAIAELAFPKYMFFVLIKINSIIILLTVATVPSVLSKASARSLIIYHRAISMSKARIPITGSD